MLSDLQLVYIVPRNSTQLLNQISSGARASLMESQICNHEYNNRIAEYKIKKEANVTK